MLEHESVSPAYGATSGPVKLKTDTLVASYSAAPKQDMRAPPSAPQGAAALSGFGAGITRSGKCGQPDRMN